MGYTHYWRQSRPFTPKEWNDFQTRAQEIISAAHLSGIPLAYEYDEPAQQPIASIDEVRFNGVEDDGHETFIVAPGAESFAFCKTALKPYDAVVVAMLIEADRICDAFSWSSDGDGEDGFDVDGKSLLGVADGVRDDKVWNNDSRKEG